MTHDPHDHPTRATLRAHDWSCRVWSRVQGCRHCGAERAVLAFGRRGFAGAGQPRRARLVDGRWVTYRPRADLRESCHAPRHVDFRTGRGCA